MRKWTRMLLLGTLFAALLCTSASAVVCRGVYGVQKNNLNFLTAEDGEIKSQTRQINGKDEQLFVDAEKITFTPENATGENLIFVLKGANTTVPTKDNIVYIDQKSAGNSFTLYPSALLKGAYTVCMSTSGEGGGIQIVDSFQYYEEYRWGDANLDQKVNIDDAQKVLKHTVVSTSSPDKLTGNAREVADVTHEGRTNIDDALKLLRYAVYAIKDRDALAKDGDCMGT